MAYASSFFFSFFLFFSTQKENNSKIFIILFIARKTANASKLELVQRKSSMEEKNEERDGTTFRAV